MTSYRERLEGKIPGGAHTYSRGADQFPENAPQILVKGLGSKVWDIDGRSYIDYGMALRAVTLGYSNSEVNRAVIDEVLKGNNLTRPSLTELQAAEGFTDAITGAEMVKFAKNGSNVTTAALKLARAYTGRSIVCVPRQQPFFSYDDWFIGKTPMNKGCLPSASLTTKLFDYGDIDSVESIIAEHPGDVAAVILEPATSDTPCGTKCNSHTGKKSCLNCPNRGENFLVKLRELTRKNGIVLIFDEMITGFRWAIGGGSEYFGVTPDLMTFGKALGNGHSVSAVAGNRAIMGIAGISSVGMQRTFLMSTTHGAEMGPLGAFLKVLEIYSRDNVVECLWDYGRRLRIGIEALVRGRSLEKYVRLKGPDISLVFEFRNEQGEICDKFKTLFMQELVRNGVLMPWIAVSCAHSNSDLELTLLAVDNSLSVYQRALDGGVANFLKGSSIKPVFRREN